MSRLVQFSMLGMMMLFGLAACSTQTVKSTTVTPVMVDNSTIPEEELLDVGIGIFDPGLDDIPRNREELTFGDVRIAETYYSSFLLAQTLQSSGSWGLVRIVPGDLASHDVAVRGTILQSDGETMRVRVRVNDATGRLWFDREYEEVVSRYSYDPRLRRSEDAFQGLYNRIANDMLEYRRRNMNRDRILTARTVAQLQFAKNFAPEVFDQYLEQNRQGIISVKRLPAENDPLLTRIESMRDRDYAYLDTMHDYYDSFTRQMETPYTEFRRMSYSEIMKIDKLNAAYKRNMVLGVAAIVAGLAGTQSNNAPVFFSSLGGIAAGGWLIKDAFGRNAEAQMHVEAIAELGSSLEAAIAPQTIDLEERTITLTGSVQEQYEQWREILAEIYANEMGELGIGN